MKRFTMILALLLMAVMPMMAERVTPETARKVATTFLNNNGAKTAQLTDLSKEAGFTNLYIFNGNPGFVVMAADDRVQPILGYSLTGVFIAEDMPENVRGWLQSYNDEIQYALDNKMRATAETSKLWEELAKGKDNVAKATTVVAPLIQTQWNQNGYGNVYLFNNLCPSVASGGHGGHAFTGCVATAMAQIMKYWGYPSKGIGSHSYLWNETELSADFNSTYYDWNHMTNTYSNTSTNEEKHAVDLLMYHCGVSVDMNYGGNGSSASTYNVMFALQTYFNYVSSMHYESKEDYSDSDWIAMVKAELNEDRPLQYRGSGEGGHSFVCDGYNSDNYFHFNWGWAGSCDGYYSLNDLTTINPGTGGGNGSYTNDQAAIFGIQPVQCAASDPTNLTYTLNGLQEITLTWTPANDAVSYNIYRNNFLVGSSNNCSYSETAPFGTNVYYVRSIDANEIMSLSSNTVTVSIGYLTPIVDDLKATYSGNSISLTWSAPEWCYPETPSSTLTYGTQSNSGYYYSFGTNLMYWGHRHLTENLSTYQGLRLYSVDFHVNDPGAYELCIFEGTTTNSGYTVPVSQVYSQPISVTTSGWNTINLAEPYYINSTQDLWIFMHNTESFDNLQLHLCSAEGDNGVYYSGNPSSYTFNNASGYAFLVKAYLTDGTYTYNLYQDGTRIASNLTDTSYSGTTLNDNAANQFVVKTNYYGGESESNIVGFAKGVASLNSLEMTSNDKMTLTENSKLTVSGDVINTNPDNLILENGAQLIHNSANVHATVKKNISGYTSDEDGWYFISSPVIESITPSENNGFLNGEIGQGNNTYDLYYYDEPNQLWKNYESQTFTIENQKGYLYANGETDGTTLQFAGTLSPSNESITINNLSHNATTLNGFNLVGNPFACNATVDKDYYIVDGPNVSIPETGHVIAPCEGVFVQVSENDASVTFTKAVSAKGAKSTDCIDIVVMQNKTTIDRARVRFGDGEGLEKFNLKGQHTQISFQQNKQDFAVVYAKAQNEMPVNFKASENGTYTISMESKNFDLDYLHLIDNLTGNDVDLLVTPSYTFEAKTNDYASRFKLMFASVCEDADSDNENFAFINNGNIVVNQKGTLQIVDVMGRVVNFGDAKHCVSTNGLAPDVYILRLITADGVKTQKIVVE